MSSHSIEPSVRNSFITRCGSRSIATCSLLDAHLQDLNACAIDNHRPQCRATRFKIPQEDASFSVTRQMAKSLQLSMQPGTTLFSRKRKRQLQFFGCEEIGVESMDQDMPDAGGAQCLIRPVKEAAFSTSSSSCNGAFLSQDQQTAIVRPKQQSRLLNLPDDVLVKIICLLSHEDLKPLRKVCTQLHNLVEEAVDYHFAYSTPAAHAGADHPATPKPSKHIALEDKPASSDWLGLRHTPFTRNLNQGQRRRVAPRALKFSSKKVPWKELAHAKSQKPED